MKFSIGERVCLTANDKVGIIRGYRIDGYILKGEEKELVRYNVNLGNYYDNWLEEDKLVRYDDYYKVSDQFEVGLADLMIDINLAYQNPHMASNFYKVKQNYSK